MPRTACDSVHYHGCEIDWMKQHCHVFKIDLVLARTPLVIGCKQGVQLLRCRELPETGDARLGLARVVCACSVVSQTNAVHSSYLVQHVRAVGLFLCHPFVASSVKFLGDKCSGIFWDFLVEPGMCCGPEGVQHSEKSQVALPSVSRCRVP